MSGSARKRKAAGPASMHALLFGRLLGPRSWKSILIHPTCSGPRLSCLVPQPSLISFQPPPGAELVRINLSEQTDMMDLLGADLPVAGGAPGEFAW